MVASATSTNGVVQGQAQEEKLIVAVKAVASSTAQLLVTCQVKADARSENNRYILTQYQMLINLDDHSGTLTNPNSLGPEPILKVIWISECMQFEWSFLKIAIQMAIQICEDSY